MVSDVASLPVDHRAPPLMRALFFSIIALFPVLDLLMAWLYHASGEHAVVLLRYYRDAGCLLLAGCGLFDAALPRMVRITAMLYSTFLACYSLASLAFGDLPEALVFSSLGTLLIPLSLVLAAFASIRTAHDFARLIRLLACYGVATTLFGFWEISHTDFWVNGIALGDYLTDIKGITTGFEPEHFLPWNFYGYNDVRRAAGLLAAPLAQGFFLGVVGLVAFAYWRGRSLGWAAAIAALCLIGLRASGTRGAMLAVAIAVAGYLLYPGIAHRAKRTNRILFALLALATLPALATLARYTLALEDSSALGHMAALHQNIAHLGDVVLLGSGVGAAGAETAAVGLTIEGGGEGAIFSIAYQLGLPGALVFLAFCIVLWRTIWRHRHDTATSGELARVLCFLGIGVATSMVTSEHILTFSGMGAFWFCAGGYLGYSCRRPVKETL